MMKTALPVVLALLCAALSVEAGAQESAFKQGTWRLEATGIGMVHSGKTDRDDDYYGLGVVEYEWPATDWISLAIRGVPVFVYHEDDDGLGEEEVVFGIGAGLTARYYFDRVQRTGWFTEASASALWHSDFFEKNSSRVNFLTEAGVGYMWPKSHWHVALKVQHISNGSMGNDNAGVNGLGLGVGYRF
jgi:hypothetical protein